VELRNREGTPVDPWPFVVVAGTGVLPLLSFGPLYLTAFGVPLRVGVPVAVAASGLVVAAAYHRFVLTYRPAVRAEVPAAERARRLFWLALVLLGVLVLLTLPLLGRSL
jgi:phosphotransferase system  glucose/maltose/N-acetylglucosamine-specific IIC component